MHRHVSRAYRALHATATTIDTGEATAMTTTHTSTQRVSVSTDS